jgi:hypothetical protein
MKLGARIVAVAALCAAMPASAAVIGDFRLNGNLTNAAGGPLTLLNGNGGVLGATGISFGPGQGPDITGFSSPSAFSIETAFRFDNVNGYRRVMDFLNGSSDTGLYILNGTGNFYTQAGGGAFAANTLNSLVFTRAASGASAAYINGVLGFSFTNAGLTNLNSTLRLFRDDGAFGGENSAGFVDYVRVYDTALSAGQVAALTPPVTGAVPEPSTWAMMLAGFAAIGFAMRRTRKLRVRFA